MKIGMLGFPGLVWMAALCFGLAPAWSQTKPPESVSKIKKVLLYNKVGGWMFEDGFGAIKAAFSTLAAAKRFELVQLGTDTDITLEYLKQFQVIVWNNNTDAGASVPSPKARQAVLDYVDQGGGWMLICNASYGANNWPGLGERLGTTFRTFGKIGLGEVVLDKAASAHGELKWMVEGFPEVFELDDNWFGFQNTVRPLPGVTVVATSRALPGHPGVVLPIFDGSGDNVFVWAREVGQGRLLYTAIGFGHNNLMEQQDSIVPRLYWENLRYAAGDYENGCTTHTSPGFDSTARVHVEAMCAMTGLTAARALHHPVVAQGARRVRLTHAPSQPFTLRVRDIQGAKVWERSLPAGTGEVDLGGSITPGVYHFEVLGDTKILRQRLLLP